MVGKKLFVLTPGDLCCVCIVRRVVAMKRMVPCMYVRKAERIWIRV